MEEVNEFDRRELIEYVRSLRLAEFRKISLSSFKTAALVIFIISATNKLLTILQEIQDSQKKMYILIFFLVSLNNIYLIGWTFFNSMLRKNSLKAISLKKYNELDRQCMIFGHIIETIFLVLAIVGHFIIFVQTHFIEDVINYTIEIYGEIIPLGVLVNLVKLSYGYFVLYNTIVLLNKIRIFWTNYRCKDDENRISFTQKLLNILREIEGVDSEYILRLERKVEEAQTRNEHKTSSMFICFNVFLLYIILNTLFIQNVVFDNMLLFKDSIYVYGIYPSLSIIGHYISKKIRYSWLECFESQIFIENLTNQQIKKKLYNEFINRVNVEITYFDDKK